MSGGISFLIYYPDKERKGKKKKGGGLPIGLYDLSLIYIVLLRWTTGVNFLSGELDTAISIYLVALNPML